MNFAESEQKRVGYLANVKPTIHVDENGKELAGCLLYFIQEDREWLKAVKLYDPYFYV